MKAKFYFSVIAMATLALSSCSQDEAVMENATAKQAVTFSTYLGNPANNRATVIDDESIKGDTEGFGVFAFYTESNTWAEYAAKTNPNFMNNQGVFYKKESTVTFTKWEYSPVKYWPNNPEDKVSFFAYAPYNEDKEWDATQKAHFSVANTVTEQKDFLYTGNTDANVDLTKQTIDGKVTFTFHHALSRIGIEIAYANDVLKYADDNKEIEEGTTITVQSITLGNDATEEATNGFYEEGDLLLSAAPVSTDESNISKNEDNWSAKIGNQSFTLTAKKNFEAIATSGISHKYQKLNKNDSYVMIIPQDHSKDGFPITIKYTVTTEDDKLGTANDNKSAIENTITNTAKIDFQPGKAYTLKLLLGMTSVKFDAVVEDDWNTVIEEEVDLPKNTEDNTL